jgi:hypothetical protein
MLVLSWWAMPLWPTSQPLLLLLLLLQGSAVEYADRFCCKIVSNNAVSRCWLPLLL